MNERVKQEAQRERECHVQLQQRAPQVLSEAEALQLESRLSVSRALLLLLEQLSPSDTPSAPQG